MPAILNQANQIQANKTVPPIGRPSTPDGLRRIPDFEHGSYFPGFTPGHDNTVGMEAFDAMEIPERKGKQPMREVCPTVFDDEAPLPSTSNKEKVAISYDPTVSPFSGGNENQVNNGNRQRRRRRNPWTEEEVQVLERGIQFYGGSYWSAILKKYGAYFSGRNQVDLKDKARTEKAKRTRLGEPLGVWGLV